MKIFVILFTFSICARCGYGQDLPLFGPLPKVPKEWSLRESSGFGEPKWRWSWIVLTNSQNGDVLSFAAHKSGSGEPRELIFWSDTAHEIFQGGLPVWTVKNGFGRWPIRNSVVNMVNSQDALEYTFIEEDPRTNRLAHGYALVFGTNLVVFVQHTSMRAITPELAHDMAASLASSRAKAEARATKPKNR